MGYFICPPPPPALSDGHFDPGIGHDPQRAAHALIFCFDRLLSGLKYGQTRRTGCAHLLRGGCCFDGHPETIWGTGMAGLLGEEPLLGLITESVTMTGGHSTAAAWAPTLVQDFGFTEANTIGAASATFGFFSSFFRLPSWLWLTGRSCVISHPIKSFITKNLMISSSIWL